MHDDYQSFFPPDVHVVADHAKRAITTFPAADRPYYGVDYPARRAGHAAGQPSPGARRPTRLAANIPVPTSYMCLGTGRTSSAATTTARGPASCTGPTTTPPSGKKQWTWGNAAFGHAWDRNLTDDGAAYVELMAGVFTDNQPDFSFLAPGETKTFSQYWYPVAGTGPAVAATLDVALGVEVADGRTALQFDATRALGEDELVVHDQQAARTRRVRSST